MQADFDASRLLPGTGVAFEHGNAAIIGHIRARIDPNRCAGRFQLRIILARWIAAPVADIGVIGIAQEDLVRSDADGNRLLNLAGLQVHELHGIVAGGGNEEAIVAECGDTGRVRRAFLRLGERHRREPLILALVRFLGDAEMVLGIGDEDPAMVDAQPRNAEADRRGQALPDLRGADVNEHQVLQVLDDEGLAVIGEGEIDRPTGEGHQGAGRLENLVGRHDDAPIGLPADLERVEFLSAQRGNEDAEEEGRDGVRASHSCLV